MHGGKIYDVDIMPFIIKQSVSNNKILYEGEVKLNFVYSVNNFSELIQEKWCYHLTFLCKVMK